MIDLITYIYIYWPKLWFHYIQTERVIPYFSSCTIKCFHMNYADSLASPTTRLLMLLGFIVQNQFIVLLQTELCKLDCVSSNTFIEFIGLYTTKWIHSVITDRDTGKCKCNGLKHVQLSQG